MSEVKRAYDSPRRRAAAEQTRHRLLTSARTLFGERGYAVATVEAIAAAAGTAPQTFYKVIGSKRAALFALLDEMAADADPADLDRRLRRAESAAAQLALLVDYRVRLVAGAFDILEAVRTAAPVDRDVAAIWQEGEARRRRNQQQLLDEWYASGAMGAGLDRARADTILWALTGPDLYRVVVAEGGWTVEQYREWLTETLRSQLLEG